MASFLEDFNVIGTSSEITKISSLEIKKLYPLVLVEKVKTQWGDKIKVELKDDEGNKPIVCYLPSRFVDKMTEDNLRILNRERNNLFFVFLGSVDVANNSNKRNNIAIVKNREELEVLMEKMKCNK